MGGGGSIGSGRFRSAVVDGGNELHEQFGIGARAAFSRVARVQVQDRRTGLGSSYRLLGNLGTRD